VHATIEEKRFYPAVKEKTTEEILRESVEEHLAIKRVIADLLRLDVADETFAAKIKVLEDEITHHVEEEEEMLFPRVERMFDDEALESLGDAMEDTQAELLQAGNPRESVAAETDRASSI
jgi:hemerythrin superfamily protein